jgi:hypothetical protein
MSGVRIAPIPASNFGHDGKPKIGLSVHHMDSSFASADGWFHNPIAQASAHVGITYDTGDITQWVDFDDVAYAQCLGNWQGWVTAELESDPARPNAGPSPAQVASLGRVIRELGTPAVPATSMFSGGVGFHRQFGGPCNQAWGQTACPGDGIVAAIPAICAAARGDTPATTPDSAPVPQEDVMLAVIESDGYFTRKGEFWLVVPGTYCVHVGVGQTLEQVVHNWGALPRCPLPGTFVDGWIGQILTDDARDKKLDALLAK